MTYQVGQKVFAVFVGRHGHAEEVEITRVGKRWVYFGVEKFDAKTRGIDGYNGNIIGRVYESEAAYREEVAIEEAWWQFRLAIERLYRPPAFITLGDIETARRFLRVG